MTAIACCSPTSDRRFAGKMKPSQRKIAALSILLAACAFQVTFVYLRLLLPRGDQGWDAAHHSMLGLMVYSDIVHHRWISFAFDTYSQVYWPFLHSWFLAASMIVFGPTLTAARFVSLMAYALSAIALGLLGYRLTPDRSILRGAVAASLWLTAAGFVNEFAVEAMTESLAIAMTLVSLLALERAFEKKSARSFVWAGLWAMVTYFTKTDYGILVIAATLVVMAASVWKDRSLAAFAPVRFYLTPVVILSVVWFAYLPKIPATISALTNTPYGPARWSVPGVLYHIRELMLWSDSPWIFVALIACFAWSWRSDKSPLVRIVLAYISIALILHTISQTKDPKHIVKLLPCLFLLAGFQVECAWQAIRRGRFGRSALGTSAPWAFAALLLIAGVLRVTVFLQSTRSAEQLGTEQVTSAICSRLEGHRSSLLVGQFAEISPYAITWKLSSRSSGVVSLPFDVKKEVFAKGLARLRERHQWISLLEPDGSDTGSHVVYAPTKHRGAEDPDQLLTSLMTAGPPDRIVVLDVEAGSAWNTTDYGRFVYPGSAFLPLLARRPEYTQSEAGTFGAEGIRMLVFDRESQRPEQIVSGN
jgi:4-amino-4-deoxy-L-arabinose transferase-like glycosyltransferase